MKEKNPKIIFIGTSLFSVPVLEKLIENKYNIPAVITKPDRPIGRKKELTPPPVKEVALKHSLKIFQPEKISSAEPEIKKINPDLFIIAAYGEIIPESILKLSRLEPLNLHPSLLPKYRGPSPIQTAILNGEKTTGTTLMIVDKEMDHGPIIAQEEIKIAPDDNYQTLEKKLALKSADLLIKNLPQYLEGKIKPREQNHSQATYTKMLSRQDGEINLKENSLKNERMVRAFYPWPGTWTIIGKKRIKIIKAKIVKDSLVLEIVQPEGKKPMTWEEFKRGHNI